MRLTVKEAHEGELFTTLMEMGAEMVGLRSFEEIEASVKADGKAFDDRALMQKRYEELLELPTKCSRGDNWVEFPDTHLRAVFMCLQFVGERVAKILLAEGKLVEMLIHMEMVREFLTQLAPFMRPEKLDG